MCYTISAKLKSMLKRARHYQMDGLASEIEKELDVFTGDEKLVSSGFSHPRLIIYPNQTPLTPRVATWGLIPDWMKDRPEKIWNSTLNARGETMFEKPSFRKAAQSQRCLIDIDGFFEYHHQRGKKYPFYITRCDDAIMTLGGLWDQWLDPSDGISKQTFSIVTTRANELMAKIHNNPKLPESRMPLILHREQEEEWLFGSESDVHHLVGMPEPVFLQAHTVRPLSGKLSPGNVPEALGHYVYEELELTLG